MSGHTPGRWHVDRRALFRVADSNDTTICSTGTSTKNRDYWEANAVLISAAPDLLEALEEIDEFAKNPDQLSRNHDGVLAKVRAAIRKAKGDA
jgi:hypothetical protein